MKRYVLATRRHGQYSGVYAVGDLKETAPAIVTAVADGAVASKYIENTLWENSSPF
ncbi:MAG: hypothetical protein ACLS9B_10300 [Coprococcus comes]